MTDDDVKKLMAQFPAKLLPNGNVRTCPARLSFPHLFKPAEPMEEGGTPKFMATLLFPPGADLTVLGDAVKAAAKAEFGEKVQGLTFPFRKQDEKVQYDGYRAGGVFIIPTSVKKPGAVNRAGADITDPDLLYPGCWVLASINTFAYVKKAKKGVSFGLQNIMLIKDDDRLGGGRSKPSDDFEAIAEDDMAFSDVMG